MEAQSKDLSLDESVAQVMKTLPPFLREYLAQGKYTPVAQGLMGKYKLRIDQGGVLERELLLLLMGVETPDDFIASLGSDAQIDQQTVKAIVQDINDQVFVPLRKQEEELTKSQVKAARPLPSQPASRPTPPSPKPAAPLPPHVAPLPPKMAMPDKSGTLGDAVRAALATKTLEPQTLLEDHEEPHIDLRPAVAAPAPVAPKMPPPPQERASIPPPQAAPAPTPAFTPAPKPVPPVVTPPAPKAPQSPITSYSVDPYREPIDDDKG